MLVQDDGEAHTINLCMRCYNLRQVERTETAVSCRRWRIVVGDGGKWFEGTLDGSVTGQEAGKTSRRTVKNWRHCGDITVCRWQAQWSR